MAAKAAALKRFLESFIRPSFLLKAIWPKRIGNDLGRPRVDRYSSSSFRGCPRCLRAEPGICLPDSAKKSWIPGSIAEGDGPGTTSRIDYLDSAGILNSCGGVLPAKYFTK